MRELNENILDNISPSAVDVTDIVRNYTGDSSELDPTEFEYMFTIRLQSRGKARLDYEGFCQRMEAILDAYTFGWKISVIDDNSQQMIDAPCSPNLLMGDSSKCTLCIQIDLGRRPLKPELIVLLFDTFWRLRANMLQWTRFWISSHNPRFNLDDSVNLWMLYHFNNDNSFRSCAARYSSEILYNFSAVKEVDILASFLTEIIVWSDENVSQDFIKRRLKKMQARVASKIK